MMLLLLNSTIEGRSQTYLGLQTGVYSGYLGRVTNPGFGLGGGYKNQIGENVHLLLQLSYFQNRAKEPKIPLYPGKIDEESAMESSLVYFQDMKIRMLYSNLDICFSIFKRERMDLTFVIGSGFSLCRFTAKQFKVHVDDDPNTKRQLIFGVGLDSGVAFDYFINEKWTWRISTNAMLTSSTFQDGRIAKLGLSSGLIIH